MFDHLVNSAVVVTDGLRHAMPIRRIDNGNAVDNNTQKKISHLPDHLLQDIGLDRGR